MLARVCATSAAAALVATIAIPAHAWNWRDGSWYISSMPPQTQSRSPNPPTPTPRPYANQGPGYIQPQQQYGGRGIDTFSFQSGYYGIVNGQPVGGAFRPNSSCPGGFCFPQGGAFSFPPGGAATFQQGGAFSFPSGGAASFPQGGAFQFHPGARR